MDVFKERYTEMNKREYGEKYPSMRFVSEEEAQKATKERKEILEGVSSAVQLGFLGTKLDCRQLSPGCSLCGQGAWSCLFLNNICNAHCFFCPTEQRSKGDPVTNGISFGDPRDYVAYIGKFQFTGVSISGGEPLLAFERARNFISAIKREFGSNVYLWLYTNGILVTKEKINKLKEAGMDEIRFNIVSSNYVLDKVKLAKEFIDVVTVEIPAIPEHYDLLKDLVINLEKINIDFLNLHQLRCTPYNVCNLVNRGYTFLHGPKVTVLESEMTALRTIQFAIEQRLGFPINYCSFPYKSRFQSLGYRKRFAPFVCRTFENITAAGFIRRMSIKCEPDQLGRILKTLREKGCDESLWYLDGTANCITFDQSLWKYIDFDKSPLFLNYYVPQLQSALSYGSSFEKTPLNRRKTIFIEKRHVVSGRQIGADHTKAFQELIRGGAKNHPSFGGTEDHGSSGNASAPGQELVEFEDIYELEQVPCGLQEYY